MNAFETLWRALTVFLLVLGIIVIFGDLASNAYLLFTAPLFAYLCKIQADKKGKDKDWAMIYGASYGLIAWIYFLVAEEEISNKKIKEVKNGK